MEVDGLVERSRESWYGEIISIHVDSRGFAPITNSCHEIEFLYEASSAISTTSAIKSSGLVLAQNTFAQGRYKKQLILLHDVVIATVIVRGRPFPSFSSTLNQNLEMDAEESTGTTKL